MSLSLHERFSRLPAPRINNPPPSQHVQPTFHVNLDTNRSTQQLSSGRTVGKKTKAQQSQQSTRSQPTPRIAVKKAGVDGSAARASRHQQTVERSQTGRQKALAQKRVQTQQQQVQPAPVLMPTFVQQPLVKPLQTPFKLAPQFTQQPAFTMGTTKQKSQPQQQTKKGTQKKSAASTTNKKGNAPPAKKAQNGASAGGRQNANGRGQGKKPAGGEAKKGPKGGKGQQQSTPVTRDGLDADMDTYMAAAPSS